jgi:glycosyltransferase involved in cell wall biosynthesis
MLHIDVGNTLRGGLRTGIQRVVRSLAFELAKDDPTVRLIAFDPAANRYFEISHTELIRSADSMADLPAKQRLYFDLDAFGRGDIFFEPDSTWSEPVPRGMLFRQLKARGVIIVVLNHDVIPLLLPEVCHPNTLIAFSEAIADHLQYTDYALTTSHGVNHDLLKVAQRFLGRSVTTHVIKLGADFEASLPNGAKLIALKERFPEFASLRYLLAVGTIEPRKNYDTLLQAFDRLDARDAALVIVGRQGWMSEAFLARLEQHPKFGRQIFWYTSVDDGALLSLYRGAYAAVLASHYEGYGLPAVEALTQGCPTIVSDAGSLPEVTRGHAAVFERSDSEALFSVLDRLYSDDAFQAELRARAAAFEPISWREAGQSVRAAFANIMQGDHHNFSLPVRQMVYLSASPEILNLSLTSIRRHLAFIEHVVVLTKPEAKVAIEHVVARHFSKATILTDDDLLGSVTLGREHTPRNTWLRKLLYRHEAVEANFIAADEDYFALRPVIAERFLKDGVHTGHYFLEDMGTWLAGSPTQTSYDHGIRNAWRLLREAAYPARGYASHMPQIINKSLVNEIYERLIISPERAWLDEWSIYFNIAGALYPRHFRPKPYAALGWPMRTGDWYPEIVPEEPAFENSYAENYQPGSLFAGLDPLDDIEEKTARTLSAFARAKLIEVEGKGSYKPTNLLLIVAPDRLTFIGEGTIVAGRRNVRRILLINGAPEGSTVKGKLDVFLTEPLGAPIRGERVTLGEACWIPLLPPEKPGLYPIHFFATLGDGVRLETRGMLTVVAHEDVQDRLHA